MTALKVDRYLADPAMDRIDHALGRPLDPLGWTSREYYAAEPGEAAAMCASPYWHRSAQLLDGLTVFTVTDAGRRALADHLRSIGDKHRAFDLTFNGHIARVVGTSSAKARYDYFCHIRDCCPDLTFVEFLRRSSIRRAAS